MTFTAKCFLALTALLLAGGGLLVSCQSSTIANRSPIGEAFPPVKAAGLDGTEHQLPQELKGAPAVLLLGYVQNAQFDADRWLIGLLQAETPARILEVPTIPGLMVSWFGSRIDAGMREGIPSEDWGSVVTVYGEQGEAIVELTGNESPRNIRVLLLDAEGKVVWMHDRGFSAGKLLELDAAVRELLAR
jgi:hypothetical protein